jgi:hypothetical protein
MSAEKGWIGEPQPEKEWRTPGWLREMGTGHCHFHGRVQSSKLPEHGPRPGLEVTRITVDDRDATSGGNWWYK